MMVLKAGRPAIHKLGDIGSSNIDEYIDVVRETSSDYIGMFAEGLGFVDVRFKKEDVRPMSKKEIARINELFFSINGHTLYKIHLDAEGYYIQ